MVVQFILLCQRYQLVGYLQIILLKMVLPFISLLVLISLIGFINHCLYQIIVMDDGVMVGKGTHSELLASCQVYQEIYYSQFKKEGEANG